jgi:hypothetical protein
MSDTRYNYTLRARRSDETLREADRNCLLSRAAAQGQLPRLQHLLRLGADVDFADDAGFTALHHAVSSGFEDCVQELIEKGADVNVLASCGVALNVAADKRRDRVAEILLRARANCEEAIAFAMESGLDVGVLREFLTQAVRSSGVESPWTTHIGASNDHNGTPTDTCERGDNADVDEPSRDSSSTSPISPTNGRIDHRHVVEYTHDSSSTGTSPYSDSVEPRARTSATTPITQTSGNLSEQALPRRSIFRRPAWTTKRKISSPEYVPGQGSLGLTTLYNPSHKVVAHIIFVHGIGGGSCRTWERNGDPATFWPREWLPMDIDFRDTKIHTFGYDADLSRKSMLSIDDFARSLLQWLNSCADLKEV